MYIYTYIYIYIYIHIFCSFSNSARSQVAAQRSNGPSPLIKIGVGFTRLDSNSTIHRDGFRFTKSLGWVPIHRVGIPIHWVGFPIHWERTANPIIGFIIIF